MWPPNSGTSYIEVLVGNNTVGSVTQTFEMNGNFTMITPSITTTLPTDSSYTPNNYIIDETSLI